MDRDDDKIRRQLDAVVGDSFDPPRKLRPTIAKWVGAALLAMGAAAAVIAILNANLGLREHNPHASPKKPVTITIVPAR